MERRTYLRRSLAAVAALAGCAAPGSSDPVTPSSSPTPGGGATVESVAGVDLPVPREELIRGTRRDAIPAITDPAFAGDWSGAELEVRDRRTDKRRVVDLELADGDPVVGVTRGGTARAYPLRILNWHEVVNDALAGPLLVTYCPLCGSAVVAERFANGVETLFGVSGLLFRSNLVLYDGATGSLWSQVAGVAIRGRRTGERLGLLPSALTTWGAWRDEHPDTGVLLPPPESGTVTGAAPRDYTRNPYERYARSDQVGLAREGFDDGRLHPKTQVIGVAAGGEATAYPFPRVLEAGVINDAVGDLPVVVGVGPGESLAAYSRRVGGEILRFAPGGGGYMRAGGSRWRIATGEAVDGPHEGRRLDAAAARPPMFWFSWLDFHPETAVYGAGDAADRPGSPGWLSGTSENSCNLTGITAVC